MKQLAVSLVLVMITASLSGCMSDDSAQETLIEDEEIFRNCLLYTSPSPRDLSTARMPSSA